VARNRDNRDYRGGPFQRFVILVLGIVDSRLIERQPTGLIAEVCELSPNLPERCWRILGRTGMAPATMIDHLLRVEAIYRHGRLTKHDKDCRDRLRDVLCSDLEDQDKVEKMHRFIAQTLDVDEAARRGHELSRILSTEPLRVEMIGLVSSK
jgi:hypothetical protein